MIHKNLSSHELCSQTLAATIREKKSTLEVLNYLKVVEVKKAHLEIGYSSLFAFCTQYLKYSDAAAHRRIQAMIVLKDLGQESAAAVRSLQEKIQTGALTLSHLATAQRVFQHQKYKENKVPNQKEKLEVLKSLEGLSCAQTEKRAAELTHTVLPKRDAWSSGAGDETRLAVTLDQETIELLERFKELSAHKNPHASTAEALKLALKLGVEKLNPEKNPTKKVQTKLRSGVQMQNSNDISKIANAPPKRSRSISKILRQQVWIREGGQCTHKDPVTGRPCRSRFKLEVDHQIPFSQGGKTEIGNLALLCRNHNQWKSNQIVPHLFGKVRLSGESHKDMEKM